MAVSITDASTVCLYDTVTGHSFGPTFNGIDEARDFLTWLDDNGRDENKVFNYGHDVLIIKSDPRIYREGELIELVKMFREEQENAN